jgi:hypothetical protein
MDLLNVFQRRECVTRGSVRQADSAAEIAGILP